MRSFKINYRRGRKTINTGGHPISYQEVTQDLLSQSIFLSFSWALKRPLCWDAMLFIFWPIFFQGFPGVSDSKESTCKAGFDPGLARSPGEAHGNPLQYSCLENPMDRGTWQATVHGVAKSQTQLSTKHNILSHISPFNESFHHFKYYILSFLGLSFWWENRMHFL